MTAFWFAVIFLAQLVPTQLPDQVQPGAVTGRLLNVKGVPAAGVRIAAVPAGDDKTGASALLGISQTDADGRYRLENIPPGRYYIFAGLIDFPSYYPNATTLDRATAIVVDAGTTVSGIDFSMARSVGLSVAGHFSIPSTMTFNNAWVATLTSLTRGTSSVSFESKIGQDGSFEFAGLPPAEYRLGSNVAGAPSRNVRVADVDVADLVVPVTDCNVGVLVSGRFVGTSLNPIRSLSLSGQGTMCAARTDVDSDGSFVFTRVPEGTYQLQLTPVPLGWSSTSLIVQKSNISGYDLPLPELIAIKGRASAEDGVVFPRTSRGTQLGIRALRVNSGEAGTTIRDDGTFELLLPKGSYRLSVPGIPAGYYLKSISSGGINLDTSPLMVRDDAPPPDIQLILGSTRRPQTGVRLSGHLTFASTGALLSAESVLLVAASGNRTAEIRESAVASDGSFEFSDVPPGIYNLETFPDNPSALYGIVVGRTDVTGIEYSLPVLVKVKGGIEWAGSQGAAVTAPRRSVSVQFTKKEGERMLAWGALAEAGSFHFYLPEGDYRFSVSGIPEDFNLAAVTAGDANILESGLRVRSGADPQNLRVTLRGK